MDKPTLSPAPRPAASTERTQPASGPNPDQPDGGKPGGPPRPNWLPSGAIPATYAVHAALPRMTDLNLLVSRTVVEDLYPPSSPFREQQVKLYKSYRWWDNLAVSAAFMHDGAFTTLAAAIRHHLDAARSARSYDPAAQGLPPDLAGPLGPVEPILARLDPLVATPRRLTDEQVADLVAFVAHGLLDPRATPERLRHLVLDRVPSGRPTLRFEFGR